jgi:hypothetical protein
MRVVAAFVCTVMMTCFGVLAGHAEKRVALIIGNGAYQNTVALSNPVNDAEDMAFALQAVGFEVIVERNVNKRSLEMSMARFGRIAQEADAALFYYAGHGIQYRGLNYLMPVDARLEDEFSVNYELTRIEDVLFALSGARGVKILILDACRNNPLSDRLNSRVNRDVVATRGLARIEAARGMIIAYATQSNQVAVDGTGRNSPFTGALIKEIEQPGLEIATLFRRVALNVDRATGGRQLPELSISMSGEFYLNTHETDAQAWVRLRQSSNIADLEKFIRQYPQSFLVTDARTRIAGLEQQQAIEELQQRELRERTERLERERRAREQAELDKLQQEKAAREAAERLAKIEEVRVLRERIERERQGLGRFAHVEAEQVTAQADAKRQTAMLPPPAEPSTISPLSPELSGSALIAEIKKELKRVGCYTGRVDDNWTTTDTKASIQKFIKYANFPSSIDKPAQIYLDAIRARRDRVCPLECGVREIERNGQCIAKTCGAEETFNRNGNCVPRPAPKTKPQSIADTMPRQRPIEPSSPAKPNCNGFNPRLCRWFLDHPHPQ